MKIFYLSEVANAIGLEWFGEDVALNGVNLTNRHIEHSNVLSYCTSGHYLEMALSNHKVSALIIPKELVEDCKKISRKGFIVSDTAEWSFYAIYCNLVSAGFFDQPIKAAELSNAVLGQGVVIEDNVVFGKNVKIGHGSIIKKNTIIGDNTIIGNYCIIGEDGFQVIFDPEGHPHCIPHVGKVRIGNNVTLADCVTVNKSLFEGETFIADYVKIGTKAHLAHNVSVGKNSVITSFVNMFGSSSVGKNVWVAPNTAIMNRVHIGDGAFVGASSLVLEDVEPGTKVFGHPAKKDKICSPR